MQKTREEIPEKDRWNVGALYSHPDMWKKEYSDVAGKGKGPHWPMLKEYQGKLSDPTSLAQLLTLYFELDRKLSKLHTYAHLRNDEDLGNDTFKHNYGLISTLFHEYQLETSWIEPEILSLDEASFQKLLTHPALKPYRFHLEKIGRMRPHMLKPEMEELMALTGKALGTASKAFGALNNADLTFKPALDEKGEEHTLSLGAYLSYLRNQDRTLRKTAFQHLHQTYEAHANTLCELIQGQVQSHLFSARARKFKSCLDAALFPHAVDTTVYENLITTVRKHLPLMHQYVAMRKKMMGLSEIHIYDLYVPLVSEVETKMDYKAGCQAVIDSVAPLGAEYQAALKKGLLEERWVDIYENARKRSGAYSSGCYDSMPYILMNYHDLFSDVETLAHEAGHSMHSFLSRKHQPYPYADYSLFVAEVASTFNEILLLNQEKKRAKSPQELAALINDEIERVRGTIFRQTMFAEFELQLHRWAEEGTPLTPDLLKKYYLQLNRDYYGPELTLDPELAIEWARIPHFYYNFYVYQYATGLSAAMALNQQVIQSPEARERYLEFLSSGGSRYPLDLLQRAGVDMRTPAPITAALERFRSLMHEFEKLSERAPPLVR